MTQESDSPPPSTLRPAWARHLWLVAGWSAMVLGFVGLFLPLLPTAPFVLVAAFCFSNGSPRWERWLLSHPHFGPVTREWREHRAVPLRAKQVATVMMSISSAGAWWVLPEPWRWLPGTACLAVAAWLWWLPTTPPRRRHD
ncbi:YbaN family protein [Rhizobacter sp. LjRoot28]|jgi:uncharacterized membrane protein YbaN (DUF454 family)|uniref:YbaN family protein n=1 Tax=Rhizobacter sp. LjRoot28 TaxID=3342309 RepID=UPI003ED07C02